MDNHLLDGLVVELRRGTQIILVLNALKREQYGYSLLQMLENQGVQIEAGTLYPLLRRLDAQGLLDSSWDVSESRPRKYYVLSKNGLEILEALKKEWHKINNELSIIFMEDTNEK